MSKSRVLVIGCGNMGASHARAYAALDEFELVGVVSRGPESREARQPPSWAVSRPTATPSPPTRRHEAGRRRRKGWWTAEVGGCKALRRRGVFIEKPRRI